MPTRDLRLNISAETVPASRNMETFNRSLRDVENQSLGVSRSFTILKAATVAFLSALAIKKITSFINESIKLYQTQELAEKSFRQAAISAGKFTEEFSRGTLKMASALQDLTGVGDETILSASKILISFDKISKTALPAATKAAIDFARSTGMSVENAAAVIGRSTTGMVDSLKRYGIEISKAEVDTKGFGAVLEAVFKKAGGQAETFRRTSAGQWQAFANALGDLREQFGEIFDTVFTKTGLLDAFTEGISKIVGVLDEFQKNEQMVVWAKTTAKLVLQSFQSIAIGIFKMFSGIVSFVNKISYIAQTDYINRAKIEAEKNAKDIRIMTEALQKSQSNLNNAIKKRDELVSRFQRQDGDGFFASLFLVSEEDISGANKRVDKFDALVKRNERVLVALEERQLSLVKTRGKSVTETSEWVAQIVEIFNEMISVIDSMSLDFGKKAGDSLKKFYTGLSVANKEAFESVFGKQKEPFEELKLDVGLKLELKPEEVDFKPLLDAVEEIENRIKELSLSEYEYKVHLIDKRIEKYRELGIAEVKLSELRNLEIKELDKMLIEDLDNMWKDLADGITNSFTDAFKEILREGKLDFEKLGDSIKEVFIDVISDIAKREFIQPFVNQMISGVRGNLVPAGFTGPLAPGQQYAPSVMGQYGPQMMGVAGAGMAGYAATGNISGGLGAAAGMYLGGPAGAMFGAMAGNAVNAMIETISGEGPKLTFEAIIEEKTESGISDAFSSAITAGFKEALQSGDFQDFKDTMKDAMTVTVKDAVISMFTQLAMQPLQQLFKPFIEKLNIRAEQQSIIEKIGPTSLAWTKFPALTENPIFTVEDVLAELPTNEEIEAYFEIVKPIFEEMVNSFASLADSLDINTGATVDNTDAILGPVNDFMKVLSVGPLAPTQSIARYAQMEQELLESAIGDYTKFSEYAQFMQEYSLPYFQAISPEENYQDIVNSIKEQVTNIPWYTEAGGEPYSPPTAEENAKALARELSPMLKEVADNENIEVNVYLGNEKVNGVIYNVIKGSNSIKKLIRNI